MYKLATMSLAALLALALSACTTSPTTPTGGAATGPTAATMAEPTLGVAVDPTTAAVAGEAARITIDEIQSAAANFYGMPVTVDGDVSQVYNNMAFSVSNTSASGSPLLVIMPSGTTLSQGQSVEVTGVLQQLDVAQIQEDLGITLGPDVESLAGQPVLIADQVR